MPPIGLKHLLIIVIKGSSQIDDLFKMLSY